MQDFTHDVAGKVIESNCAARPISVIDKNYLQ
jgi:hypothetical protein